MPIVTINPTTGEVIKSFEPLHSRQIEQKLQRASETFRSFRNTSFAERSASMLRAGGILESEKEDFARVMTLEMGKPIKGAIGEVEKCAWVCRYYADNAEQ